MLNEKQFFTKILQIIENVLLMFTLTVRDIQEMLNYLLAEVVLLKRFLLYASCTLFTHFTAVKIFNGAVKFSSKTFHTLMPLMLLYGSGKVLVVNFH